jgi:hypothetical protein
MKEKFLDLLKTFGKDVARLFLAFLGALLGSSI